MVLGQSHRVDFRHIARDKQWGTCEEAGLLSAVPLEDVNGLGYRKEYVTKEIKTRLLRHVRL